MVVQRYSQLVVILIERCVSVGNNPSAGFGGRQSHNHAKLRTSNASSGPLLTDVLVGKHVWGCKHLIVQGNTIVQDFEPVAMQETRIRNERQCVISDPFIALLKRSCSVH